MAQPILSPTPMLPVAHVPKSYKLKDLQLNPEQLQILRACINHKMPKAGLWDKDSRGGFESGLACLLLHAHKFSPYPMMISNLTSEIATLQEAHNQMKLSYEEQCRATDVLVKQLQAQLAEAHLRAEDINKAHHKMKLSHEEQCRATDVLVKQLQEQLTEALQRAEDNDQAHHKMKRSYVTESATNKILREQVDSLRRELRAHTDLPPEAQLLPRALLLEDSSESPAPDNLTSRISHSPIGTNPQSEIRFLQSRVTYLTERVRKLESEAATYRRETGPSPAPRIPSSSPPTVPIFTTRPPIVLRPRATPSTLPAPARPEPEAPPVSRIPRSTSAHSELQLRSSVATPRPASVGPYISRDIRADVVSIPSQPHLTTGR